MKVVGTEMSSLTIWPSICHFPPWCSHPKRSRPLSKPCYDRTRAETSYGVQGQGQCHLDLDASFWDSRICLLGAPQLCAMTLEVLVGSQYPIWRWRCCRWKRALRFLGILSLWIEIPRYTNPPSSPSCWFSQNLLHWHWVVPTRRSNGRIENLCSIMQLSWQ